MPADEYYFASDGILCKKLGDSPFALCVTDEPQDSYEFREGDPIWLELGTRAVFAYDWWIYAEDMVEDA